MAPKLKSELDAKLWGKEHDLAVYDWLLENDKEDNAGKLPTGKHLLADTPELKSWSSSTLNSKMKTIRKKMEKQVEVLYSLRMLCSKISEISKIFQFGQFADWHLSNEKAPMRLAAMVKKWNKEEERDNPLFGPNYVPKPPVYPPHYVAPIYSLPNPPTPNPNPLRPSTTQPQSAAKRTKLVSPSKPTLSPDSHYTKDGVRACQVESTP
ncbi:hypothetical protein HDU78_003127, partial [Chytriomyces hyalinus]